MWSGVCGPFGGQRRIGQDEPLGGVVFEVLGFKLFKHFDDADISTEYTSLMSKVMDSGFGVIKMPINEPAEGRRKSQIEEYLDWHNDTPGVQHLALRTDDELHSVHELRRRGVNFLKVPQSYYDEVWKRVEALGWDVKEDHEKIADLGILVDADDEGYLVAAVHPAVARSTHVVLRNHLPPRIAKLREGQLQSLVRSYRARAGRVGATSDSPGPTVHHTAQAGSIPGPDDGSWFQKRDQSCLLWRLCPKEHRWSPASCVVTTAIDWWSRCRHWAFVVSNLSMVGKSMGLGGDSHGGTVDLGDGGTPARFMLAAATLCDEPVTIDGSARLRERPMGDGIRILESLGARFEWLGEAGHLPVRCIRGITGERSKLVKSPPVSSSRPRCWWALDEPRGHAACAPKRPPAAVPSHDPALAGSGS